MSKVNPTEEDIQKQIKNIKKYIQEMQLVTPFFKKNVNAVITIDNINVTPIDLVCMWEGTNQLKYKGNECTKPSSVIPNNEVFNTKFNDKMKKEKYDPKIINELCQFVYNIVIELPKTNFITLEPNLQITIIEDFRNFILNIMDHIQKITGANKNDVTLSTTSCAEYLLVLFAILTNASLDTKFKIDDLIQMYNKNSGSNEK